MSEAQDAVQREIEEVKAVYEKLEAALHRLLAAAGTEASRLEAGIQELRTHHAATHLGPQIALFQSVAAELRSIGDPPAPPAEYNASPLASVYWDRAEHIPDEEQENPEEQANHDA